MSRAMLGEGYDRTFDGCVRHGATQALKEELRQLREQERVLRGGATGVVVGHPCLEANHQTLKVDGAVSVPASLSVQ